MALYTKKGNSNIPKDAVVLSENDAIVFMQNIVQSWRNPSDVFYVKYGPGILSALAGASCLYINNYYRHRLRLQSFGRFSTYLPTVIVPSFASLLTHTKRVQEPILIEKETCPLCTEVRAVTFQVLSGIVYPLFLAPCAGFMMAIRYHTYNIPDINVDPKSVWKLYTKLTRPMLTTFGLLAGVQAIAAAFICYKEVINVYTVKTKLMTMEDTISQGGE